jgi:hypothetical protein
MSDEEEFGEETQSQGEGPQQTIRRMPDDQPDVGPYFPSGMSAPEAAMAGATAGLTEEQKQQIEEQKQALQGGAPAETEPETE